MPEDLPVNARWTIPGRALRVEAARASGPGGQHVNTTETKVHLFLLLETCGLPPGVVARVREARSGDVSRAGELRITCGAHRSRTQNLEEARARLVALVLAHMTPPRARRATKPTKASKRRRVDDKKKRGAVKKGRGKVRRED